MPGRELSRQIAKVGKERLFDLVGEVGCGLDGAFGKGFSREVAKAARKPRRGGG